MCREDSTSRQDSAEKHQRRLVARQRGRERDQARRVRRARLAKKQQQPFHGGRCKASERRFDFQQSCCSDHLEKKYERVTKFFVASFVTVATPKSSAGFEYWDWFCSCERCLGCSLAEEDSFWYAALDKKEQRRSEIQRSHDRAAKRSLRIKKQERSQKQLLCQRTKGGRHKAREASFVSSDLLVDLGMSEDVAKEAETGVCAGDTDAGNNTRTTVTSNKGFIVPADGQQPTKPLHTSSASHTAAVVRVMSGHCISELSLLDCKAPVSEVIFKLAAQEQVAAGQMDLVHDKVLDTTRSLMHSLGPLLDEAVTNEGSPPVELVFLKTRGKVRIPEDCRCISEAMMLLPKDGGVIELNGAPMDDTYMQGAGGPRLRIEATVHELVIEASSSAADCLQSTSITITCPCDDATGRVCLRGLKSLSVLSMEHCGSKHISIDSCSATFLYLNRCQGEVLVNNCKISRQRQKCRGVTGGCAIIVEQKVSYAPVKIQNSELHGWPVCVEVLALPQVARAIHLHATCIKPCPCPIWDPLLGQGGDPRVRLTAMKKYMSKAARPDAQEWN